MQLLTNDPGQLLVAAGIVDLQVYFYRGNGWSNAQSSDDVAAPPPATPGGTAAPPRVQLPTAVRMVMSFGEGSGLAGSLTRDIRLGPQSP
jgi:general secretion pathway protein J